MQIKKIHPIGYCEGVRRALEATSAMRFLYPSHRFYVFGMLVHNEEVTKNLARQGIETIDVSSIDPEERLRAFREGDFVIFTAHGHPASYDAILSERGIHCFDAVCPKVRKILDTLLEETKEHDVIYIGKKGHPETIAALSVSPRVHLYDIQEGMKEELPPSSSPFVTNQTTLSFLELSSLHEEIRHRYPNARFSEEICDVTKLRQKAIMALEEDVDLLLLIGSRKSSNTATLYEVAKKNPHIRRVEWVGSVEEAKALDLTGVELVYLASGTSTSPSTITHIEIALEGGE